MAIHNPQNGFIPKIGERVRNIGACHPLFMGKVVEVVAVNQDAHGTWWFEAKHQRMDGGVAYTSGVLGGLEPAGDAPIDILR